MVITVIKLKLSKSNMNVGKPPELGGSKSKNFTSIICITGSVHKNGKQDYAERHNGQQTK